MNRPRTQRAKCTSRFTSCHKPCAAAALALFGLPAAYAADIPTGNPDLSLRFDNTVKAGAIYRLKNADPVLVDSLREVPTGAPAPAPATFSFPQAENFNAGDDNFRKRGFVSERLDLLSEFDLSTGAPTACA